MNLFCVLEDWRTSYFLNQVASATATVIVGELKKCITGLKVLFCILKKPTSLPPHFNCKTPKNLSNKSGINVPYSFYCRCPFFNHQNERLMLRFGLKWRDVKMLSDSLQFQRRLLIRPSLNREAGTSYSLVLALCFWAPCQDPQQHLPERLPATVQVHVSRERLLFTDGSAWRAEAAYWPKCSPKLWNDSPGCLPCALFCPCRSACWRGSPSCWKWWHITR